MATRTHPGCRSAGPLVEGLAQVIPGARIRGLVIFVLLLLLPAAIACAQVRASEESRVKAAYLFNFAKFVEWPEDTFHSPDDPTLICATGDDRLGEVLLDAVAGKTANGRRVEARRPASLQDMRLCQVLFIGFGDKQHIAEILEGVGNGKILTVGQAEQFIPLGGMINLVQQSNRIEFEIAPQAAAAAGLRISSRLLAVARVVSGRRPGGGQ